MHRVPNVNQELESTILHLQLQTDMAWADYGSESCKHIVASFKDNNPKWFEGENSFANSTHNP
jgi:hypothetical protein